MALRTSWMSTLLTMSNEFSCAMTSLSSNLKRLLHAMPNALCPIHSQLYREWVGNHNPDRPHGQSPLHAMSLTVSHVRPQTKQPEKVFRSGSGDFFVCNLKQTGQRMRCAGNKGGFVALAAIGSGGQPWGVGLHQNPIHWDARGDVAERLGFGISKIPCERYEEAEVERAPRLLPARAEAMHHAAQAGRAPMFFQNQQQIVPGVGGFVRPAAVDEDGALAGGGNFKLLDEARALDRMRRALVVIIEANLPAGDDFRLGEQAVEFGKNGVVRFRRVVRIHACTRVEPRKFCALRRLRIELAADAQRAVHSRGLLTDADGEDRADPCFPCARQHRGAVVGIALAVQVGVRIDQQTEPPACTLLKRRSRRKGR